MGNMIINCRCPLCGKISSVACDSTAWTRYESGELIQVAFPNMNIHTRETLISGMCVPCQERFFIEDDEDDCDFAGDCADCPNKACCG